MSYEIVRNLSIKHDDTKGYYASMKTASNNVYPHYYEQWDYVVGEHTTKEELEKCILLDFFHGNLQKGGSIYRKAVKAIHLPENKPLLNRYYKIGHVIDTISKKLGAKRYTTKEGELNSREKQLQDLIRKLIDEQRNEAKNTLYSFLQANRKELNQTKVEPFVLVLKGYAYPTYITKATPNNVFFGSHPRVFTSKVLYQRALTSSWFKKNCEIVQVSVPQ